MHGCFCIHLGHFPEKHFRVWDHFSDAQGAEKIRSVFMRFEYVYRYGAGTPSEPPKHIQTLLKTATNHPKTTFRGRFVAPKCGFDDLLQVLLVCVYSLRLPIMP